MQLARGIVLAAGSVVKQVFDVAIEAVEAGEHATVVDAGEFEQLASLTRLLPVASSLRSAFRAKRT
jgi:hypothetical protein